MVHLGSLHLLCRKLWIMKVLKNMQAKFVFYVNKIYNIQGSRVKASTTSL